MIKSKTVNLCIGIKDQSFCFQLGPIWALFTLFGLYRAFLGVSLGPDLYLCCAYRSRNVAITIDVYDIELNEPTLNVPSVQT